jgi:outer membrane protein
VRKRHKLLLVGLLMGIFFQAQATDLSQVYQDAEKNDATYLGAYATYESAREGIGISRGALLPQINLESYQAYVGNSKLETNTPGVGGNSHIRGTSLTLNANQVLFDFSKFMRYFEAKSKAKAAAATFYAAKQDLMNRVVVAYFTLLKDKETIAYTVAQIHSFKRSRDQAQEQYRVGLKTLTDVYTARADYSNAIAENVKARNQLDIDVENLRVITNHDYKFLSNWRHNFPLVSPSPKSILAWAEVSEARNLSLQAAIFTAAAAKQKIKEMFAGHLPTVTLQGQHTNVYSFHSGGTATGVGRQRRTALQANLLASVPVFSGGTVSSEVSQARHDYEVASWESELTHRGVVSATRKAYLGILSGISQVKADKAAIVSGKRALEGIEAGYKVGTETMVNVLETKKTLFQSQKNYANDRLAYVENFVALKNSAGMLSPKDIVAMNRWLVKGDKNTVALKKHK